VQSLLKMLCQVESLFTASLHISDFVQTQNEAKILTLSFPRPIFQPQTESKWGFQDEIFSRRGRVSQSHTFQTLSPLPFTIIT
jgi:hypothetical protein